ncbi:MAG: hypothetical protein JSW14_01345 [Candidatus Bathyarchaeum sp.]|nr:MAG: hypothetical protein JSW14_01345 [Candidatus Bathyarchaeum sp.]
MTILKKKSYYALGLTLAILGIIVLLVVVWRWWATDVFSSPDIISAINSSFGNEDELLGLGLGLSLLPYTIIGIICLVVGSVILVLRRERVTVTEEVTTLLECPLCKHRWEESKSRTHLESIGYPTVRTLSRHRCPKCAKFIRPKIVATKK